MEPTYLYAIISSIIVSLISLVSLGFIAFKARYIENTLSILVSFAAGALLGDVFIHLIPKMVEEGQFNFTVSLGILGSIIIFFILETFIHWHHHHGSGEEKEHATHPFVWLNLIGDGLHNFIDGLIIGAAFLLDIKLGFATAIAVTLHEIPQEFGDFGILVYGGFSKAKALLYNLFSGLVAVAGTIIVLLVGFNEEFISMLIALAAGSFIYIAMADLIPEIHKAKEKKLKYFISFAIGILVMILLLFIE